MLLLLLLACPASTPTSWEDCAARSGSSRDDCYTETLPKVFCDDPERGLKLVEEHVTDVTVRDFIWLQVTSKVAPESPRWCEKIVDTALAERCQTMVKRPHLHRDLAGQICPGRTKPAGGPPGAAPGGPGGPPPGGPGGPPPGGAQPPEAQGQTPERSL
jgi:hypothetical protein